MSQLIKPPYLKIVGTETLQDKNHISPTVSRTEHTDKSHSYTKRKVSKHKTQPHNLYNLKPIY